MTTGPERSLMERLEQHQEEMYGAAIALKQYIDEICEDLREGNAPMLVTLKEARSVTHQMQAHLGPLDEVLVDLILAKVSQ